MPVAVPFLATAGAGLLAYYAIKDTYLGSKQKITDAQAAEQEHAEWENWDNYNGHFSGFGLTDQLDHKYKWLQIFGIGESKVTLNKWKAKMGILWNNVVFPNLLPIGLTAGALYASSCYAAGRQAVNAAIATPFRFIGNQLARPNYAMRLGQGWGAVSGWMTRNVPSMMNFAFGSVGRAGMTAGALAFGAFFLDRFRKADGHEGQEAYFRPGIWENHGHPDE